MLSEQLKLDLKQYLEDTAKYREIRSTANFGKLMKEQHERECTFFAKHLQELQAIANEGLTLNPPLTIEVFEGLLLIYSLEGKAVGYISLDNVLLWWDK